MDDMNKWSCDHMSLRSLACIGHLAAWDPDFFEQFSPTLLKASEYFTAAEDKINNAGWDAKRDELKLELSALYLLNEKYKQNL
jgi:hypothetical protein